MPVTKKKVNRISKLSTLSLNELILRKELLLKELEEIRLELSKAVEAYRDIDNSINKKEQHQVSSNVGGMFNEGRPPMLPDSYNLPDSGAIGGATNMDYSFKVMDPSDSIEDIKGVIAEQVATLKNMTAPISEDS